MKRFNAPPSENSPSLPVGTRVMMWKQDPSVSEIGKRKVFLPTQVLDGPKDDRVVIKGLPVVPADKSGDFIEVKDTESSDAVHTFAVVRQTVTMYERALASGGQPAVVRWNWNDDTNQDPIEVFPHGLPDVMNAYYEREEKALRFGHFMPPGHPNLDRVYACRSLDIVAHETGHAILDGFKPGWEDESNPPQTGAIHEAFGDITAIFLTLSELDLVDAVIAQTRAKLEDESFLTDIAEQFGLALQYPTVHGLRNAVNPLTVSDAGTEVHALSRVMTAAVYGILCDIFASRREPDITDDAITLHTTASFVRSLFIRAIIAAPEKGATFADVAKCMLSVQYADDPSNHEYYNIIKRRFEEKEILVSPAKLSKMVNFCPPESGMEGVPQDRSKCCSTLKKRVTPDTESAPL